MLLDLRSAVLKCPLGLSLAHTSVLAFPALLRNTSSRRNSFALFTNLVPGGR